MRIPIRYQLMLPLVTVAVASLLALAVFYSNFTARQARLRIERQLKGVVDVLESSSYPLTDAVLKQMAGLAGAEFVLTDSQGTRLAASRNLPRNEMRADETTAENAAAVVLGRELSLGGSHYLHSSVWLRRAPLWQRTQVLHILFPLDDLEAAWRAAFVPPMLIGLATVLAVALVTHLAAARVSRILKRLGGRVQSLAEGDFAQVEQPTWNDETRDLAKAVSQTAERLAEYEKELRRSERTRTVAMLGAGLAHEMRNAATGCRLAVDLHAEGCHAERADDSLEVARRQLVLMENRLQQLLQLGKESHGAAEKPIQLAELVTAAIALVQPAARHAGVQLEWDGSGQDLTVLGSADLLSQAVTNLLVNGLDAAARSHARDGGNGFVRVELRRCGNESELVIADTGDGPGEGFSEDGVFEPFVTSKPEGVGLGLTVAKRVVESLGGQIGWSRHEGVTKFCVRLPLAAMEQVPTAM